MKKGKNRTQLPIIYAAALHEIHKAFSGINLLSKYSFSLRHKDQEAIEQNVIDRKVKTWSAIFFINLKHKSIGQYPLEKGLNNQ